jgi:hypothetical protein
MSFSRLKITLPLLALLLFGATVSLRADFFALDPGVRATPPGAGGPLDGLSDAEKKFFDAGLVAFNEVQDVQDDDPGLGPRFNLDSCGGCHSQPAIGGSSPFTNPQVEVATKANATNVVPFFVRIDGPVVSAVQIQSRTALATAACTSCSPSPGRDDAPGCSLVNRTLWQRPRKTTWSSGFRHRCLAGVQSAIDESDPGE